MENKKYSVLLVEDNKYDQMAFKWLIKQENLPYDFKIADSISEARKYLGSKKFDIVITDYYLGDGTAFDVFDLIINTPIIFTTGAGDEEIAVKALKAGAYHYLKKDLQRTYLKILPLIIENAIKNKREEEQFKMLSHAIMSVEDSVYITNLDDKIIFVNEAFCKSYDYEKEEIIGKNTAILWKTNGKTKPTKKTISQTTEQSLTGEFYHIRKDGSEFPILLSKSVLDEEDGKAAAFTYIVRDITERTKAKKELKEAKKEVEAANAELLEMNNHLTQTATWAKELAIQAEMANGAKSDFLANMSHEIRTPMNGVIGMTAILLETKLNSEQREYAETVRNSAESLLTIINDILDFSKIEAGKLDLEFIDFDLRTTMDEVIDLLAFKTEDKGLAFSCFLDPQVEGFINGDPGRLKQILINLASNAVKFTDHGEIAIRGKLQDESETEICIRISVNDTGMGISQSAQQKLFQSFSQVDTSTTRKFGGTGLGLAISKQLVEMMGGQIGIESEEGKGSTFWFTIRFKKQARENRKKQTKNIDLTGKHILVIDNNKTNRDILKLQLQSWHCVVKEAENATTALKLLHHQAKDKSIFGIAIVDMQMPGMDGETLGKIIKNDPTLKNTKLIMCTSVGQRGDAKRMSDIGFEAYLTKPLKQSQLYDCLVNLLNQEPGEMEKKQLVTRHTIAEDQKLNLKVLLAEDNIVNQKVANKMLQKLGCQVDLAINGKEVVEAIKVVPYDIVLMDCQMPEMDGFEATGKIRKIEPDDQHTPIIALTANAMQGDRERCIEAGMDDYIAKPLNYKQLAETITKWKNSNNSRP